MSVWEPGVRAWAGRRRASKTLRCALICSSERCRMLFAYFLRSSTRSRSYSTTLAGSAASNTSSCACTAARCRTPVPRVCAWLVGVKKAVRWAFLLNHRDGIYDRFVCQLYVQRLNTEEIITADINNDNWAGKKGDHTFCVCELQCDYHRHELLLLACLDILRPCRAQQHRGIMSTVVTLQR